jgi:hypothetical protein
MAAEATFKDVPELFEVTLCPFTLRARADAYPIFRWTSEKP